MDSQVPTDSQVAILGVKESSSHSSKVGLQQALALENLLETKVALESLKV